MEVNMLLQNSATTHMLTKFSGSTELPAPTATFQYVAVGVGYQNYNCTSSDAVPISLGATATLFDFTAIAYDSVSKVGTEAIVLAYTPPNSPIRYPYLGFHMFDSSGLPFFNLTTVGKMLYAEKLASVDAPPTADPGPDGTDAVPWLMLGDRGGSTLLSQVYRVGTVGGKAPKTCPGTQLVGVRYAAEYWFYG